MAIQIHLMLLLIFFQISDLLFCYHSNTSHVTINLYRDKGWDRSQYIQIHLMLLLISVYLRNYSGRYYIQIHLMLLLIWMDDSGLAMPGNIQIHLMLLLIFTQHWRGYSCHRIQIHLMLLLINNSEILWWCVRRFKYISCYY